MWESIYLDSDEGWIVREINLPDADNIYCHFRIAVKHITPWWASLQSLQTDLCQSMRNAWAGLLIAQSAELKFHCLVHLCREAETSFSCMLVILEGLTWKDVVLDKVWVLCFFARSDWLCHNPSMADISSRKYLPADLRNWGWWAQQLHASTILLVLLEQSKPGGIYA